MIEDEKEDLDPKENEPKTLERGSPEWLEWKRQSKIIKENWIKFYPQYKEQLDRFQKEHQNWLLNGRKYPRV